MSKVLDIKNLTVYFEMSDGIVKAVNDLSLSMEKGTTLGVVGETGAGKTTMAKTILRLIPMPPGSIKSGEIYYYDQDILKMTDSEIREVRGKKISMIFQDPMTSLNPVLTVEDQIAEVIELHEHLNKAQSLEKAREMLEMVGIPARRGSEYPHQFSGGMKQRVVIAIAMACNPDLLLADEPTTALDVTIQAQVLDMMRELRDKQGTSLILITHDLGVVAQNCDHVAIVYAGEVVEFGEVHEIYNRTAHPYTVGLLNSVPKLNENVKRLHPIDGLMPDPTRLPEGCFFAPRCPYATDKCQSEHPQTVAVGLDHSVRCHYPGITSNNVSNTERRENGNE